MTRAAPDSTRSMWCSRTGPVYLRARSSPAGTHRRREGSEGKKDRGLRPTRLGHRRRRRDCHGSRHFQLRRTATLPFGCAVRIKNLLDVYRRYASEFVPFPKYRLEDGIGALFGIEHRAVNRCLCILDAPAAVQRAYDAGLVGQVTPPLSARSTTETPGRLRRGSPRVKTFSRSSMIPCRPRLDDTARPATASRRLRRA